MHTEVVYSRIDINVDGIYKGNLVSLFVYDKLLVCKKERYSTVLLD